MFENLAQKGIKQFGRVDIETIKLYHPEVVMASGVLAEKMGLSACGLFKEDFVPDFIASGYRDRLLPGERLGPHCYGCAIDLQVSHLDASIQYNRPIITEAQIRWIKSVFSSDGVFKRAGLYPYQNTIHLDSFDNDFRKENNLSQFWVKDIDKYHGFENLQEAFYYAKVCANRK